MECSRSVAARRRAAPAFAALLLSALLGSPGAAAAQDREPPARAASTCVSCHTDAARLKTEAAKVPAAAGSALQAGKG